MFPFGQIGDGTISFSMRSLRFSASRSTHLSRTLITSATSRTVWTFSCWVKHVTAIGFYTPLYIAFIDSNNYSGISILGSNAISVVNVISGVIKTHKITTALLSDPTAWYHVQVSSNGSSSLNVYINGVLQTSFSTNVGPDASNWFFNASNQVHYIGRYPTSYYSDYILADVVWVDGQALPSTSFITVDINGKLIPKSRPTSGITLGSYGFWLSFNNYDSADASKLAYDDANGARGSGSISGVNNWIQNNFNTTVSYMNDSLLDVPIDYNDTIYGRGNHCTITYINATTNTTIRYGGLNITSSVADMWHSASSTMAMTGGKWYAELIVAASNGVMVGIFKDISYTLTAYSSIYIGSHPNGWVYYSSGFKYNNNNAVAYGATFGAGDIISIIYDSDNGKLYFAKNGIVQNSGDPVAGTGFAYSGFSSLDSYFFAVSTNSNTTDVHINFGQQTFYATSLWNTLKAAGYKTLCTQNFPMPVIKKPEQYFDFKTWTGTSAARNITTDFSPGLIWIKDRNSTAAHVIQDSVRGAGWSLSSSSNAAETYSANDITAILPNGISLGTAASVNFLNDSYAGIFIKESLVPGLDIVSFTAPASGNFTAAHNLGVKPDFVIVKSRGSYSWACTWPNVMLSSEVMFLGATSAVSTVSNSWLNTDSSNIGMLIGQTAHAATAHVAYVFKNVPGVSKFGVFYGTNTSSGQFVYLGFKPKFVMLKYIDSASSWVFTDSVRNTYNPLGIYTNPNVNDVEFGHITFFNLLSNGFKIITTNFNSTTGRIAYVAFAEKPSKYTGAF